MSQYRVHLPLKDGSYIEVLVTPNRVYGRYTGRDLIDMYGKRVLVQKPVSNPVSIKENDIILRLSTGPLPDTVRIQDKAYKTRDFIRTIERVTGLRIISKRTNKVLKHMQNTSLRIQLSLLFFL